jgi:hypothetical protein
MKMLKVMSIEYYCNYVKFFAVFCFVVDVLYQNYFYMLNKITNINSSKLVYSLCKGFLED